MEFRTNLAYAQGHETQCLSYGVEPGELILFFKWECLRPEPLSLAAVKGCAATVDSSFSSLMPLMKILNRKQQQQKI